MQYYFVIASVFLCSLNSMFSNVDGSEIDLQSSSAGIISFWSRLLFFSHSFLFFTD